MTDQVWSYIVLVTGCVMIVVSHFFNLTDAVGAGIVGAGIQAFTAQQRATVTTNSPNTTTTGNPPIITTAP